MTTFSIDKKKQPFSILKFRYGLSFIITILSVFTIQAQKKVTPVTQSTITNIPLPAGSKLDKRTLSEIVGKALLQEEAKNLNTTVTGVEIIYLSNQSRFTSDSLVKTLTANGWSVSVIENDHKYAVLKKNNQSVLAYFEIKSNEISLYFGQINSTQPETGGNNTVTTNPVTAPVSTTTTATEPVQKNEQTTAPKQEPVQTTTNQSPIKDGFQFNTSNFDDGWVSTVGENWVEVTKGQIKVLLHYPRQEDKEYISQQDEKTKIFWNLLVAPRYSNLSNFELLGYNYSSEPAHYAAGNLVDQSGKNVYVTLFSKAKSGWIEIITPDKNTFVSNFQINNPNSYFRDWDPLIKLASYNKFAIGPSDLIGKWSTDFSSVSSLYNVYSGVYVGASIYASRQSFTFKNGQSYHWKIATAQGNTGGTKVDQAESDGTYQLKENWQISFSKIDNKAKVYNAYFSCIKGARLLWLQDVEYGSYTCYGLIQ